MFQATVFADEREVDEFKRMEQLFVEEPNYFTRFAAEQLRSRYFVDAVALESDTLLGDRPKSKAPNNAAGKSPIGSLPSLLDPICNLSEHPDTKAPP